MRRDAVYASLLKLLIPENHMLASARFINSIAHYMDYGDHQVISRLKLCLILRTLKPNHMLASARFVKSIHTVWQPPDHITSQALFHP